MARKRIGAATTTIQAPWANLVTSTITNTSAVATAPSPLTTRLRRSRDLVLLVAVASSRDQCRTMPAWLSVKERNTPRMYSWISRVTLASKATIRSPATRARRTIPFEKTSRSPRFASWWGR